MIKFVRSLINDIIVRRKTSQASDVIIENYGETLHLLKKYDEGQISKPKSLSQSQDLPTIAQNLREIFSR